MNHCQPLLMIFKLITIELSFVTGVYDNVDVSI